ncbi:glycoside hydrolase family 3 C-terminal domain-containing protein [Novosphingobium flavum]|uniref:beta-glucosidase n=1 Tax=Novosphingobium flavum TaxID=1778672 RepID=A0A7X1KLV6_9SPHN|nr:glycoside hydrolase family 3 N-terminal domain-containing protein [Novosphingobium flavum]MBC2665984.1 glycoside hydrolase family 3 C-terminal domain-containing protein [Novosphingobium flavum]
MTRLSRRHFLATTTLAAAAPAFAAEKPRYRDPAAPVAERVADLLSRMTLEEKVAQMRAMWFGKAAILDAAGNFAPDKAAGALANGIGQLSRGGDWAGTSRFTQDQHRPGTNTLALLNAVQRHLVEQTRLGIPALVHEEAAHGFAGPEATIFPIPPGLGSTWNPALVEQAFTVAAREARAHGAAVALAPVLDLARDPRWGRVEEFFGEDPFLVGAMALAATRGLQGRARPIGPERVFATLKHFVHGTPEGGLNLAPADMSQRTLRGTYLVPFRRAIAEGDAAIVMPSYNEVGGVPAHAHRALLQQEGRRVLGFKGPYFSDYAAIPNLVEHHHVAADDSEAAAMALRAGVDADLPEGAAYARLPDLVRAGKVPESAIDLAVGRILALKFEAGLFERPYTDPRRLTAQTNRPTDVALAREVARQAVILLKNDGVLPLAPRAGLKIAVIGPNAEEALLGGYSGENSRSVGLLEGLRRNVPKDWVVTHAEGVRLTDREANRPPRVIEPAKLTDPATNGARIAEAVAAARAADVVILALGDKPELTREAVRANAPGDRMSLKLFGDQDRLVEAIAATGKPLVSILLNGRILSVPRLTDVSNALIEGWYLGQEAGNALADVLLGATNPGGKLPVTVPHAASTLPAYVGREPSALINHYIETDNAPLFPFGFGLSYTTFTVSAPRLSAARIRQGEGVTVSVDVTNTGSQTGDEVVQIYLRDEVSSAPRPLLELKGFERVRLQPGETRTVAIGLPAEAFAFWNAELEWVAEPGRFTIHAGNSAASLKSATLELA